MKEINFEQMEKVNGGEYNASAAFACGLGVVGIAVSFYAGFGFMALQLLGEATGLACVASIS